MLPELEAARAARGLPPYQRSAPPLYVRPPPKKILIPVKDIRKNTDSPSMPVGGGKEDSGRGEGGVEHSAPPPIPAKIADVLDPVEDSVFELIADGVSYEEIGKRLGVSKRSVFNWVARGGESRQRLKEEALKVRAEKLVEESGELLEKARKDKDLSPAQANIVREQSKRALWLAQKYNRDVYGEQPAQVNVGVNFGSLHLDALRQHGNKDPRALPLPVLEAEEINEDGEDGAL